MNRSDAYEGESIEMEDHGERVVVEKELLSTWTLYRLSSTWTLYRLSSTWQWFSGERRKSRHESCILIQRPIGLSHES